MTSLAEPPIFIVGHPRSGTTWLNDLLGLHPELASGTETHLFNLYLAPLFEQRKLWLWDWVDNDTLDNLIRDLVVGIFESKLKATGKTRIVEKTPTHRLWLSTIARLFPQAVFIHSIRDGRAVASSLIARRSRTQEAWIEDSLEGCAKAWQRSIDTIDDYSATHLESTLAVRYEDLTSSPHPELTRLLRAVGVADSAAIVDSIFEQLPILSGRVDAWRKSLSEDQQHSFWKIAGPTLQKLGYSK